MLLGLTLVLSACGPATKPVQEAAPIEQAIIRTTPRPVESASAESEPRKNVRVDDPNTYRFPQMLPMDGIRPVYNPEFEPGNQVDLEEDELILGVAIDGHAKAYPITVLRSREMVNDELAGIPLLVTW
jgi:hypothetical protein